MAQADSVPSVIRMSITGATSTASTNRRSADLHSFIDEAGRVFVVSNIGALFYATAVLLLVGFPWNIFLILLLFLCRNRRIVLNTVPSPRGNGFSNGGRSL
jgi:hypothetical protein